MKPWTPSAGYMKKIEYITSRAWIVFMPALLHADNIARYITTLPVHPKTAEVRMPDPVIFTGRRGRAVLPATIPMGFRMDLEGQLITGRWDVQAQVMSLENGSVTFRTRDEKAGHLVYRLPENFRLDLKRGEAISIQRTPQWKAMARGYRLEWKRGGGMIMDAGRLYGDTPIRIELPHGIVLGQSTASRESPFKGKYGTVSQIPLLIRYGSIERKIIAGETCSFETGGHSFKLRVLLSLYVMPVKRFLGIAEGSGFTLEYLFIEE